MTTAETPLKSVTVITTGGTIEKTYDEFEGTLENRESRIKERILSRMRLPYTRLNIISLFSKDSLYMTEEDRKLLLQTVREQSEQGHPIVILHGTDTMDQSAQVCLEGISQAKVPIVFTGAMKPMGFDDSDATQNTIEALMASQLLEPGVYISFHNRIFKAPRVRKNKQKRTFESY